MLSDEIVCLVIDTPTRVRRKSEMELTRTQNDSPPLSQQETSSGLASDNLVGLAQSPEPEDESDTAVCGGWPAISGYQILGELGRGGMGIVYKARQAGLNRLVALKMIRPGAIITPKKLARFHTEAQAVATIQHPNIVQIYEIGEHEGIPYFSMEFVPGGTLSEKLRGQALQSRSAARLVETLARAIHEFHQRGFLHRDLKPSNILLTTEATPKITDFGLAKQLSGPDGPTQAGETLGTPCYMAPEQVQGKRDDLGPTTDVYALGAILYTLLAGRPPFDGESMAVLWATIHQDPEPPGHFAPRVPVSLEAICLKCLQKEPAQRFATALELAEELHRFRENRPDGPRKLRSRTEGNDTQTEQLEKPPTGRHKLPGSAANRPRSSRSRAGIRPSVSESPSQGHRLVLWALPLMLVGIALLSFSARGLLAPPVRGEQAVPRQLPALAPALPEDNPTLAPPWGPGDRRPPPPPGHPPPGHRPPPFFPPPFPPPR
jgi:serine/threonine protein kinase